MSTDNQQSKKQWGGRFSLPTDKRVEEFTSSLAVDQRLLECDITASMAHARMLGKQGIISESESAKIIQALTTILDDYKTGKIQIDPQSEDIHSDVESKLTERIGQVAGKLHTARSRNDQVVTDLRLYLRKKCDDIAISIRNFQRILLKQAESNTETIMPGMTHTQHAQPISLAHHLLTYFWMMERDFQRLNDQRVRINQLPLGSAALAGTGFNLDRQSVADELHFEGVIPNSLDAVGDRDFVVEFLATASIGQMHLSKMAEELIWWSSPSFGWVELSDAVTTGSSIMPQKKNPDVAELIRGRVGHVYGDLIGALTMLKGLSISYHRDMQEDKTFLFRTIDTYESSIELMTIMIESIQWKTDKMKNALKGDFSNATDLADFLVRKGISFRHAHEIVGKVVQYCIQNAKALENISEFEMSQINPLLDAESLHVLQHEAVLKARLSEGGTSPTSVQNQIEKAKKNLNVK